MLNRTPLETMQTLVDARSRGDITAAVDCYENNATVVLEPGKTDSGRPAIVGFTEAAMNLSIVFGSRDIIEAGDIAMHYAKWTLTVPSGQGGTMGINGCTTDVLRRQADGRWLLALDNAWGSAVLDAKTPD